MPQSLTADLRHPLLTAQTNGTGGARYVLQPNRSMSKGGMIGFVAGVGALTILVALRFVALDAWMVLPFAVAEVTVLGLAFYLVARAGRRREIIELDDLETRVIRENGGSTREWRFQSYWLQVVLQPDPNSWYPSRLFLRSHGKQLEIGQALTDEERRELSDDLKRRLVARTKPNDE